MLLAGQLLLGLVLLVTGGELLVRGAAALASALRISPLVIGLTVVAFGTSAPELGVSLQAALTGNADVCVGNVVGSNIINVLLILGASSLVAPLVVSSQLIRLDVPLMIAASAAVWWMSLDGRISTGEGAALFTALLVYIVHCIRKSRSESAAVMDEFADEYSHTVTGPRDVVIHVLYFVVGLVLLGIGSKLLVDGAITIASALGVSQLVIGLTIVAIGTSLPEAVTSVVASYRGQRDIAVGNVVGSNLFNLLCVLGLTSIVAPGGVTVSAAAIEFDIPVMVAVAVICFPIFLTGRLIRRWEGALFLVYYAAYNVLVVLLAKDAPLGETIGVIFRYGLIPITLVPILLTLRGEGDGNAPTTSSDTVTDVSSETLVDSDDKG